MAGLELADLKGRKILVGVCGGISAYKTVQLVSYLVQSGGQVEVIATPSAMNFVGNASFRGLTGRDVRTSFRQDGRTDEKAVHIELGLWAELFVVAPATATTMGKMSVGIADNLVASTFLAVDCPVLLAPAMNPRMWKHRAVKDQIERLRDFGTRFTGPATGHMSCGEPGPGRMSEPEEIYKECVSILTEG